MNENFDKVLVAYGLDERTCRAVPLIGTAGDRHQPSPRRLANPSYLLLFWTAIREQILTLNDEYLIKFKCIDMEEQ